MVLFKVVNSPRISHGLNARNLQVSSCITFKIRNTLHEIEKYQIANPLKTYSLNTFATNQNKLLKELKKFK